MVWRWLWRDSELEPTRCEMTSSVEECAPRAHSTHGVHHEIVEVNIVIGVVLGEVLVARFVPLVVDGVIAHVVIVVFVVAIFIDFPCMGDILFTGSVAQERVDPCGINSYPKMISSERVDKLEWSCKNSEKILWMAEFLNTETHTPFLWWIIFKAYVKCGFG